MNLTKNLILFASGTGSNVAAIIDYFKGKVDVKIALIVTNNPNAGVLQIAYREGIATLLCETADLATESFINELKTYAPSLLILAGFLKKIPQSMIQHFPGQIINIHPALLPKYGGKGMYGSRIHEAVIAAKEPNSGISIHYVNENYDEGRMILQASCTVHPEDTADDLAQRIHRLEHFYYPRCIEFLLNQTVR